MRIALLEEENKRLKRQLLRSTKSDGPQPNTGAVSQLIERWIDTMQDTQRQPKNRNSLEEEKRALETKVRELEAKIALKDCSIQTFLDMIKQIAKVAGKKTDEMPIHGLEGHVYPLSPKQTEELLTCFGGSVTPRKLVLLRLGQQQEKPTGDHDGQTKQGIPSALDVPLRLDQAAQFVRGLETRSDLLATGGITMKACSICRVPKLLNNSLSQPPSPLSHSSTLDSLNEFHPRFGRTSCCSKHICNTCLPPAIISSVTRDWWHRLPDPYWLRCPTPDCQASLPLRYNVDMTNVLRSLGDPDVLTHVRLFERATLLRTTLEGLPETPTPEALARAADLHAQLATHGRAHPFFDMHRGMSGMKVELLPVDSTDGSRSLRVPVFTSLLVRGRQTTGRRLGAAPFERECAICAESVPDVTDGTPGDEAAWSAATRGFPGDWARLVRAFPTPALLPECSGRHALDACRGCLARHLEASLEALGRAGCDRLSCPSPGCGHVYTHAQLAALATSETFARYDRFRLLSVLAALPNFRWCLREGCGSGQIYDGVPSAAPQPQPQPPPFGLLAAQLAGASGSAGRVACDACGFEMCFAHQTPWHAGLSCAAYDRQLRGGRGPAEEQREEAATRAWIAAHTKACPGPGCGVPVEKKGGCFHMTCRACRFEFCWECLADWGGIQRRATPPAAGGVARRRYERLGHNEGCFFRDLGAPLPTMITGNDIEEATRGL
ncbi:RBR-type E3 ubiquitin transferase [Pleurostoma richardsiae]|uniref:RBR-type E3 ubiquitin transferase n=1 Tax=Pleurostoma richardsiae TaxID=41990 RepID=A0AA38S067_9PEZI|nr:RBR-type E3 ubiquitin transferase [Pleurostoma richardsiae]